MALVDSVAATLYLLPLAAAVVAASVGLLSLVNRWMHDWGTRIAIPLFGTYLARDRPRRDRQIARLRAAHVTETHRAFASRTVLLAGVFGVVGAIVGVYLVAGLLEALAIPAATLRAALPAPVGFLAGLANLPSLSLVELLAVLVFASATLGALLAVGFYWARWQYLDQRATSRANAIEASIPRTVAFVFALSRSGMSFPQVLDTLTDNRRVYGEAATEIGVAVRDMQTFGTDILTALQRVSRRTPSDNMAEFTENLASVLGSGRSLSAFLRDQYERYQEQAEAQQQQYLELLSTFAEAYVTVLVAGPLFMITVLTVIGLVLSDTLPVLRFITYVGIPLGTIGFIVYIDSLTQADEVGADVVDEDGPGGPGTVADPRQDAAVGAGGRGDGAGTARTDGGTGTGAGAGASAVERNRRRLDAYRRLEPVRGFLRDPLGTVTGQPAATLAATLPFALAWLVVRNGGEALRRLTFRPAAPGPGGVLAAIDSPLVEASIVTLAVYAVVHGVGKRRRRALEDAVPDLLDRMASVNEAGMTVVESIERVSDDDLGPLEAEFQRTYQDIQWGADAGRALQRLQARAGIPSVTRAVTLITNAMAASGDIAPVLRIAADEAEQSRRLRRERRQEMITYLMVIYVSFFVFLGIVAALTVAFIPAINEAAAGAQSAANAGVSTGPLSGLRDVNTAAYSLLFFHVTAIQAVCSGFVAGMLGEGRLRDGTKHATVLLAIAYAMFVLL
jgi:flagellar protein FlaJ